MLVLSRKNGERVMIGDDIVITCLGSCHNHPGYYRLGISAPQDTKILRESLFIKAQEQAQQYLGVSDEFEEIGNV